MVRELSVKRLWDWKPKGCLRKRKKVRVAGDCGQSGGSQKVQPGLARGERLDRLRGLSDTFCATGSHCRGETDHMYVSKRFFWVLTREQTIGLGQRKKQSLRLRGYQCGPCEKRWWPGLQRWEPGWKEEERFRLNFWNYFCAALSTWPDIRQTPKSAWW